MTSNEHPISGEMLTEIEAARYLNVSVSCVRGWRLKGCGPRWARLIGNVRYKRTDLEAFITESIVSSTDEAVTIGDAAADVVDQAAAKMAAHAARARK